MKRRLSAVRSRMSRRARVAAWILLTGVVGAGCATSKAPDLKPYVDGRDGQLEPTVKPGNHP